MQVREKRLSPRRAPRRSLLLLSPKRAPGSLKITPVTFWLTPDSFPNHGRPSEQEYPLRLKRPLTRVCRPKHRGASPSPKNWLGTVHLPYPAHSEIVGRERLGRGGVAAPFWISKSVVSRVV
jgi:hypothetical protein